MDPSRVKYVITSPLSLARVLWWYAEDDLWPPALAAVLRTVQERTGVPADDLRPWRLPRLHGRYAPG